MPVYHQLPDFELAALLKKGDHHAFTEIYHRYKRLLYTHAYQRLKSEAEVEDIIHELFTTLWIKREQLVLTSSLSGYLYTAVRNRILDFVAHQQVVSGYIQSFQHFIDKAENVSDYLLREKQLNVLIEKEIARLPPKMRAIFELSRKSHLSHRQIALQLGVSEKTVKSQVNNALKILRGKLGIRECLLLMLLLQK